MGYYVRAFCLADAPPPIGPVLDFARERGAIVSLDPEVSEPARDDPSWRQVGILYKTGRLPILLEVNRRAGEDEDLVSEEIDEFLEFVEDTPRNRHRKRVEEHLKATKFVVAAQLATNDIDDDGYNALGNVLSYFVAHCGGLIQADGEGFYDGDKVIVAFE